MVLFPGLFTFLVVIYLFRGMAGASHWIWPEGCPLQIPTWHDPTEDKDIRVLILNKVPFLRKFIPIRTFDQLATSATIVKVMSSEEVESTLKQLGGTSTEERHKAVEEHKKWKS
jgi:hypothetical protein